MSTFYSTAVNKVMVKSIYVLLILYRLVTYDYMHYSTYFSCFFHVLTFYHYFKFFYNNEQPVFLRTYLGSYLLQ